MKGRIIRGKSKKETKQLLAICPHHVYSKKGKLKPTIDYDNGMCTCYLCGATFSAAPYDNGEFNKKHKFIATCHICDIFLSHKNPSLECDKLNLLVSL